MASGTQIQLQVLYDFGGNAADPSQIPAAAGQLLVLKQHFDDGWSLIFDPITNREGIFPTAYAQEIIQERQYDPAVPLTQNPSSQANDVSVSAEPSEDRKYEKYERMKKAGLAEGAILNAMKRDGLTPPLNFFGSNFSATATSSRSGKENIEACPSSAATLDPRYEKYERMKKAGLGEGAILNAMKRDGITTPPANFFETNTMVNQTTSTSSAVSSSAAATVAVDPKYEKYERMKKAGLAEGAILNAMKRDGITIPPHNFFGSDVMANQSTSSPPAISSSAIAAATAVDPKYEKYERMKKAGLAEGAILNAMKRDGVTPPANFFGSEATAHQSIPSSHPASSASSAGVGDPKYEKYERMKKAGLSEGAILNAMKRDGIDPPSSYIQSVPVSSGTNLDMKNIDTTTKSNSNNSPSSFLDGIKGFDKSKLHKSESAHKDKEATESSVNVNPLLSGIQGFNRNKLKKASEQKTMEERQSTGPKTNPEGGMNMMEIIQARALERKKRQEQTKSELSNGENKKEKINSHNQPNFKSKLVPVKQTQGTKNLPAMEKKQDIDKKPSWAKKKLRHIDSTIEPKGAGNLNNIANEAEPYKETIESKSVAAQVEKSEKNDPNASVMNTEEKCTRMLRGGVSPDTVKYVMEKEGLSENTIAKVLAEYRNDQQVEDGPISTPKDHTSSRQKIEESEQSTQLRATEADVDLEKYKRMKIAGIDSAAIKNKMILDGVAKLKIDEFMAGEVFSNTTATIDSHTENIPTRMPPKRKPPTADALAPASNISSTQVPPMREPSRKELPNFESKQNVTTPRLPGGLPPSSKAAPTREAPKPALRVSQPLNPNPSLISGFHAAPPPPSKPAPGREAPKIASPEFRTGIPLSTSNMSVVQAQSKPEPPMYEPVKKQADTIQLQPQVPPSTSLAFGRATPSKLSPPIREPPKRSPPPRRKAPSHPDTPPKYSSKHTSRLRQKRPPAPAPINLSQNNNSLPLPKPYRLPTPAPSIAPQAGSAPTREPPTRTAPTRTAPTRTAPTRSAPTRSAPTRAPPTR